MFFFAVNTGYINEFTHTLTKKYMKITKVKESPKFFDHIPWNQFIKERKRFKYDGQLLSG